MIHPPEEAAGDAAPARRTRRRNGRSGRWLGTCPDTPHEPGRGFPRPSLNSSQREILIRPGERSLLLGRGAGVRILPAGSIGALVQAEVAFAVMYQARRTGLRRIASQKRSCSQI